MIAMRAVEAPFSEMGERGGLLLNVQGVGLFVVHCNCNLIVPILFVFDLIVNLFRIALWPSIEKKDFSWLFAGVVYSSAILAVAVPFMFAVQSGQNVEFN